jgi:heme-degrading monooxygenase HmoA
MELATPYYAVIFTNTRTEGDDGYAQVAEQLEALARKQPGFIDFESARSGLGISVSYWDSLEAIAQWKSHIDHEFAQKKGISNWYAWYKVRVCLVEREYEFKKEDNSIKFLDCD